MGIHPGLTLRHLAGAPNRPLLVLAPSLGTGVDRLWGVVAESLPQWHVVGWDLPGHGHSPQTDRLAGGFDLADLAAAVLAAVDDLVGPGTPVAWAGDSVGGAIGLHLALDRPDRVTHVATLCSAAKFGTAEAWQERAALVRAEGMTPMLESTPARWFGPAIRSADDGDARMQAILTDLAAVDAQSYARVCEAIGSHDVRDRLTSLTAPLLAVAGAEDIATPPSVMQEIVDGVPNGRLEVLPGVAHLAPYEDPAGTADLLRAFLAG